MEAAGASIPEDISLRSHPEKFQAAFLDRYRSSMLGNLVRGIIHNLNGSLQVLSMRLELLQRGLAREAERLSPETLSQALKCQEQADRLTSMMAILTRTGVSHNLSAPRPFRLNELLQEELALLGHDLFFKHQVRVHVALAPELPPLQGDPAAMSQALGNLLQNALEAMVPCAHGELRVITERKGDRVRVLIGDTGCGIAPEVRPRLFQPFCTTKGAKHAGLGLYMARELLAPYGASFHYSSQAGDTAFEVSLPLPA